ncbi:hypothetical protein Bbelb_301180 [Branchiostoma belcheri]|nr:hypothetical protein Bbelb_301180 [Branchiostoma belcheri]
MMMVRWYQIKPREGISSTARRDKSFTPHVINPRRARGGQPYSDARTNTRPRVEKSLRLRPLVLLSRLARRAQEREETKQQCVILTGDQGKGCSDVRTATLASVRTSERLIINMSDGEPNAKAHMI